MKTFFVRSNAALCCPEHEGHTRLEILVPDDVSFHGFTVVGPNRTNALAFACRVLRSRGALGERERPAFVEFRYGGHA